METLSDAQFKIITKELQKELYFVLDNLSGDSRDDELRSKMNIVADEGGKYAGICRPIYERISGAVAALEACFGPRNMKKDHKLALARQKISVITNQLPR